MLVLGIDVGGSGIKGAPVDIEAGKMVTKRYRIPTPRPSTPEKVAKTVAKIANHFKWEGPIGCGFPAVVQQGVVRTAANIDKSWIGTNVREVFTQVTGNQVVVINDADAAGLAEMTFGAGKGHKGVVLLVTIGTGLGTSLFINGKLLPNTELGHIEINGEDAEKNASDAARTREKLSWKQWGKRFNNYLNHLEKLIWPDVIILGGGVSKKHKSFTPYLDVQAEVVIAKTFNQAGIIGGALAINQINPK